MSSAFMRIALELDVERQELNDAEAESLLEHLGWETADRPRLEFLIRTIQRSSPYMPRGGYNRKAPHALVKAFQKWLESQQEPLQYDIGEKSGRREVFLASGGLTETLRVILIAPSNYLQKIPARVLCYRFDYPEPYLTIPNLLVRNALR